MSLAYCPACHIDRFRYAHTKDQFCNSSRKGRLRMVHNSVSGVVRGGVIQAESIHGGVDDELLAAAGEVSRITAEMGQLTEQLSANLRRAARAVSADVGRESWKESA